MSRAESVIVQFEDVHKQYTSGAAEVHAVAGIDLTLLRGTMVGVTGPSGCGKTTMLNLLGALDAPSRGRIVVDGLDVTSLSGREQVAYRRTKVGFVFQTFHLIPNMTAEENVVLPMEFAGRPKRERMARAHQLLHEVGIPAERFKHHPSRLSGGGAATGGYRSGASQ